MKTILFYIVLFVLQFFIISLQAQDDNYYIDDYKSDNSVTFKKSILKVNTFSIINGDIPITYEKAIHDYVSFEAGVGYLLPYYFADFISGNIFNEIKVNPSFGYSIWLAAKYYYSGDAPFGAYNSIQYRRKYYFNNTEPIIFNDVILQLGKQYIISEWFVIDINVGAGLRHSNIEFESNYINFEEEYSNLTFIAPFSLKLGFVF